MKPFLNSLLVSLLLLSSASAWASIELNCTHFEPIKKRFLSRHILHDELTPPIENRTIDRYVKNLDPSKLYLLNSDVTKVKKSMANIFNKEPSEQCKIIEEAHAVIAKRMEEAYEFAKKYLDDNFKINSEARLTLNADKRDYPKSKKESEAFLEKYIQLQMANYIAADTEMEEAKDRVIKNYERSLRRVRDETRPQKLSTYVESFASALDPHSSYFSKEAYEDFEIGIRLSLEGIGATLSNRDGFTVVEQLIPGGSAAKSNLLQPKDKIIGVAQGTKGDMENVIDQELRDVVRKIRGKKGTEVRLRVLREEQEGNRTFEISLIRDKISIEDELASIQYVDREIGDQKIKVGLITLSSFYADMRSGGRSSSTDVKRLLREARQKKVDAVVLDLSNNGGGSLRDAVDIAGLFFREGNVVLQSSRDPRRNELLADTDPMVDFAGPLVVHVSRVSASASEIVAGTLQDYRRAVVTGGDHTFGKGTVQAVEDLSRGLGALKTTIGMFFTPGGRSTQHVGVGADIPLPSRYALDEIGEKNQDYSLPPKTVKPFLSAEAFVPSGTSAWRMIDRATIERLKDESKKRVEASEDFSKVLEDLEKTKSRRNEIIIGDILKDRSEDDVEKEEEAQEVRTYEQSQADRRERYLKRADIQEALNIAADLALLQSGVDLTLARKGVDQSPKAQVNPKSEVDKN